ncbi:tRNA glutamyl-Q(34) synthetase GluQRS [Agaribacterium haliotis]|uniref:tRNA glutamyl-Q(34) synthetase GluQRS n=1 Tax=Agaribacterium haliotis TaxID=2013869 RepID=UPI000BB58038|nr:tRNA glutamyl-Q(34) synthetase GluQRS [Agaribacterium haliotis]
MSLPTSSSYRGRFAPSPSGPLHLGSLLCALASWLDARYNRGQWLVRIEDIDPPREQAGADLAILESLQKHGLYWDETPSYQSHNQQRYRQRLAELEAEQLSYRCNCNRKRLQSLANRYDGHCRNLSIPAEQAAALRLNCSKAFKQSTIGFDDWAQGPQSEDLQLSGDFIIHRKDGLFAYQLAVSCDDVAQSINHIVRGSDLLETTCKQLALMQLQQAVAPNYMHIPVLCSEPGLKLSKQNHAEALDNDRALENLLLVCKALHMPINSAPNELAALLNWAVERWPKCRQQLRNKRELLLSELR